MGKTGENEAELGSTPKVTMNAAMVMIKESLQEKISACESDIPNPYRRASNLFFQSRPGLGKSTLFGKAAIDDMKCGFKPVTCANLQEGDMSGIPLPIKDKDGVTIIEKIQMAKIFPQAPSKEWEKKNEFTWIDFQNLKTDKKAQEKYKKIIKDQKGEFYEYFRPGVLFLDEFTDMDSSIRKEVLNYADGSYKRQNDWPIMPPSWVIVAAGNREDDIEDYVEFSNNVLQRFDVFELEVVLSEFAPYMETYTGYDGKVGFHPIITSYLSEHKEDLSRDRAPGDKGQPSPRRWEELSDAFRAYDDKICSTFANQELAYNNLQAKAHAKLGQKTAYNLMKYFEYQKQLIPVKEIIETRLKKDCSYMKLPNHLKIYSLHTALDNIDAYAKDSKKKEAYSDLCINVIENTITLLGAAVEDFLLPIVSSVVARPKFEPEIKKLSPSAQEAIKKAQLYNTNLGKL